MMRRIQMSSAMFNAGETREEHGRMSGLPGRILTFIVCRVSFTRSAARAAQH